MIRSHRKRIALVFFALLGLLIAVPVVATWRQVRQERLNRNLIAAVKRNDDRAFVSLLNQGADTDCRDSGSARISFRRVLIDTLRGKAHPVIAPTALMCLVCRPKDSSGDWKTERTAADALLSKGADVNARGPQGATALMLAADQDGYDPSRLAFMLQHGADANIPDDQGRTPLMAVGTPAGIEQLLKHSAQVNATDHEGNTALMRFARYAYDDQTRDAMQCLLRHGADVNARNRKGETALSIVEGLLRLVEEKVGGGSMLVTAHQALEKTMHVLRQAGAKE